MNIELPPSFFASLGQPCCSVWGKSEIEWLALAYVQALANDGDTWKKLTRKRVLLLLTNEQERQTHGLLSHEVPLYLQWFDAVSNRLTDADGAFSVRGYWSPAFAGLTLETCPFCDGKALLKRGGEIGSYYVHCTLCDIATPPEYSIETAVCMWNRRTAKAQP